MALTQRCPAAGLHHSDQGCTYASEDYQRRLEAYGATCSMSRRGDCDDSAVMEAFFSSVKMELADHFASCGEAKRELVDYIEGFYNQRRRPSTLGQISPAAFECRAAVAVHAVVPVDANASTRDLEDHRDRSFPQRAQPASFLWKEERRDLPTT